jgi:ribonuclease HI
VAAACDGACSGNPGPGGWGSLLRFEDGSVQEFGAADPATTNNRMELQAALVLLEQLKDLPCHPNLTIRTDSRYLIDGFSKWMAGWKRKGWRTASGSPVLNRDLWEALDRARLPAVPFTYVKGHSGDPDNDRCDAIAVAFSKGGRPALARASFQAVSGAGPFAAGASAGVIAGPAVVGLVAKARSSQPDRAGAPSPDQASAPALGAAPQTATKQRAGAAPEAWTQAGTTAAAPSGSGPARRSPAAGQAGELNPEGLDDPAPAALTQLLSRLELADRLAAGGFSLNLVELAQLVQLPMKQLAEKPTAWTWRDWRVLPHGEGRWRLERGAAGSDPVLPGT